MKKKLAILGASYLQMPLVEKAKELGIETHCFAWNEGAVCQDVADYFYPISVLDYEGILAKCKELKIDGITTIAMDISIPTINKIAEELNLVGNSEFCSITTTHKAKMKDSFRRAKISSAFYIETLKEDLEVNNLPSSFPLVVKPIDRSGSLGITIVHNVEELKKAVVNACEYSFQKKCIIEQFIEGVEVSVEGISYKGQHQILAVTDKKITPKPYFVETEHHQPSQLSEVLLEKIKAITLQVLDATKVENGASHTELIIDKDDNIYVNEIGSRMGGDFIGSHLVPLSTGYDYLKAVIEIALGDFSLPKNIANQYYSGVYFLSLENKHLLKYFEEDNDFIVQKEMTGKELKSLRSSADRSGYIIYQSKEKIYL